MVKHDDKSFVLQCNNECLCLICVLVHVACELIISRLYMYIMYIYSTCLSLAREDQDGAHTTGGAAYPTHDLVFSQDPSAGQLLYNVHHVQCSVHK